jgi:hypothetical protein
LDINTEDGRHNQNVFMESPKKVKQSSRMSESSVYYEPSKKNVIEEYSNKLSPIEDKDDTSEQNNLPKNSKNGVNKLKYFSHLNV